MLSLMSTRPPVSTFKACLSPWMALQDSNIPLAALARTQKDWLQIAGTSWPSELSPLSPPSPRWCKESALSNSNCPSATKCRGQPCHWEACWAPAVQLLLSIGGSGDEASAQANGPAKKRAQPDTCKLHRASLCIYIYIYTYHRMYIV